MQTPYVRTDDFALRSQQWDRLRSLTSTFLDLQTYTANLMTDVKALKTAQAWEWQLGEADTTFLKMLEKHIRSRVGALKQSTDALSSLQSELMALQTVLDDNYERTE